jgi:dTDP-4-amino-4,6-dideoxygalactose transaminase
MIPHSRPFLGLEEEEAAAAVLRSGQLSAGTRVASFEQRLASRTGAGQAAAVSSGTAALHLGLLALGVGPGHRVAMPSFVCSALLQATRHAGAEPLLVDVDPQTGNLDPADLPVRLTPAARAVILPHMFGLPADTEGTLALGLPVIEDCAMSLGAGAEGAPVGSRGTLSVFSFYATKVIACGEGGMAASADASLVESIRDMRDYDGREDGRLRFNYKMSDLHAAVGEVQLARLDAFLSRRRELAALYTSGLSDAPCRLPPRDPGHIFFRYVIRVDRDVEACLRAFEGRGVAARRPIFRPLHRVLGLPPDRFPGTEEAYRSSISLPLYPSLSDREAETVIRVVREVLR